jgi:hypothetical protein
MPTTEPTKSEIARKINRTVVKYVAVRVITGVGIAVVGTVIGNALDRKLNGDEESPEN